MVKEQASALGRAGKKLRLSLEKYQHHLEHDLSLEQENDFFNEIADNVWELVLQREFIGFVHGNLIWVKENYVIPSEALNRLGRQR